MKRKSTKEAALEPQFEADDEFLADDNQGDDWRQAEAGESTAKDSAAASARIVRAPDESARSEGTLLVDPEVGETASDAFKALAAQIINTFGTEAATTTEPMVEPTTAAESPPLPVADQPLADPFVGLPPLADRGADEPHAAAPAIVDTPATPEPPDADPRPAPAPTPLATVDTAPSTFGDAVAPRITVHAFCLNETQIELVKDAARDRRMERASTVVRPGGLPAAVEFYQNQPTPSLIIVEAGHSAAELLSLLGRLAETCDPGTKVIVIGQANDIGLYRELMRQGVSEYLVPPLTTLKLISGITNLYADPSAPFVGRQIAFCGARGGVGSSTLAHNFAQDLSQRMAAGTVLVDLDLAFGTAGLNFNQDPVQGIADALSQPDRLDPVLMDRMMVKQTEHLSLFAAPANLDQDYEIGADAFEEVIRKIRSAAPYLILDLPHQWSRWQRRMLLTSDEVVIVAEPDLASLRNTKNLIDLVRAARPNDPPPRVILNKCGLPGRPEIPVKDFGEALSGPPDLIIPFDAKAFGEAANNGQMVSDVAAKSKAAESIAELTRLLTNQRLAPAPPAQAKASLLTSLFKRK